jgi:hypothetical protein
MSPSTGLAICIVCENGIAMVVLAGLPILLMWLTGRLARRWAAIAIGAGAVGAVGYLIVDTYYGVECGQPIFAPVICDAPGGPLYYLFAWFTGPVAIALLLAAISFQYLQLSRHK